MNHFKTPVYFVQNDHSFYEIKRNHRTPRTSERSCSEPLAEVQGALLVVLVLHAPHPEAGGLLGLRKLREHSEKSVDISENNRLASDNVEKRNKADKEFAG